MRLFTSGLLSVGLAVFEAALCSAAPDPELVLRVGMEWNGSFARETVNKNAAYMLQPEHKTRKEKVDPFWMRITDVDVKESTVTGEFSWHTPNERKAVRFKGTFKSNGQFNFPVTAVIRGQLHAGVIGSAIMGVFGANAETVRGTLAFVSRRVTAFEAELVKEKPKGGKKGGKKH